MRIFNLYICAVIFCTAVLGLFLSVPCLNAQNKDNAGGGDKAKAAAKPAAKPAEVKADTKADAKTDVKAPESPKSAAPKPAADDKPLTQYKAWNIDVELESRKDDIIKGLSGNANAAERDRFFEAYYFARWTDPKTQGQVQNYLSDFITKDLKTAGNGRNYLLQKSFDTLKKMAEDATVNPTAKYNAVLAIGQLSQSDPTRERPAPVAYAPALPYLVAQYNKADNPEYIKLGTLLGIVRHCAMGIADENLKTAAVPNLLVKVITDGKPTADGDKDAQYIRDCFRIRAVEGLTSLSEGNSAVSGNVTKGIKTFYDILENTDETVDMRVCAARALGGLNYKVLGETPPPVPYEQVGMALLNYAKRLSDNEIQIIDELQAKTKAETGGVASYGSDMSGGMSTPVRGGTGIGTAGQVNTGPPFDSLPVEKKLEVVNVFQRVKAEFSDIHFGMRGAEKPTGSKTVKAGIQSVIPANEPIITKLDKTGAAMQNLFRYMDEKDEQAKKLEKARADKDKSKTSSRGSSGDSMPEDTMSGSGTGMSGGANANADKNMDIKPLKVNLGDIQEALKTFSSGLDTILKAG